MRRLTSFAAMTAAFALILFYTGRCDAELIVSPNAYADAEGPGSGGNSGSAGRGQHVFPASDFQSLSGPGLITQFAWRPDGLRTTPFQGVYTTLTFKFSTTSAAPGDLSMTFADNIGDDEVVVLSATDYAVSSQNRGPAGGPKEFEIVFTLDTPFTYDPSQGNLLIDQTWEYVGEFYPDLIQSPGPEGQFIGKSNDLEASTAVFSARGFVTQFTVVPEPTTLLLAMFGMASACCYRRRMT